MAAADRRRRRRNRSRGSSARVHQRRDYPRIDHRRQRKQTRVGLYVVYARRRGVANGASQPAGPRAGLLQNRRKQGGLRIVQAMKERFMLALLLASLAVTSVTIAAELPEWPGFAGPHRNWSADSRGLASAWPASGPKKLWSRPLGEGYSGIAVDNGALYTMYRRGDEEVVAALDAKTGKTVWEHPYAAKIRSGMGMETGLGPHATPLVAGDRVFAVGILAHLFAFNKKTGKILWEKDLYKDFAGSSFMGRGYACSPLAYEDTIILSIGGAGHAVVALKQSDGSTAWATADDYQNAPSSPSLIKLDGQDQVVTFLNAKA